MYINYAKTFRFGHSVICHHFLGITGKYFPALVFQEILRNKKSILELKLVPLIMYTYIQISFLFC